MAASFALPQLSDPRSRLFQNQRREGSVSCLRLTRMSFCSPLPVFSTPPGFRVSVDCGLVAFARSSSSLYWLAWRSLTPCCQVGWLAAAPCHLCPCLVSPSAAGNGRSWALSAWISSPGKVPVKNLLPPPSNKGA